MKDPRREYEAALADFSQPGNRNEMQGKLGFWGCAAGLTAEEIIADARAAGVTDRDRYIESGWNKLKPKADAWLAAQETWQTRRTAHRPRPLPKPTPPPTFPYYVRDMVAAGGGAAACADLLDLSPVPVVPTPQLQTRDFLRACFDGGDLLFIDNCGTHQTGRPGENIRSADAWVDWVCLAGDMGGDLITPNPLTGEARETTDKHGRPYQSYILKDCIARFPFLIVEFDDAKWAFGGDVARGLAWQCAFWRGLLTQSPLAPRVAAVIHSGGKSLHGLLHVGAATLAEWEAERDTLRRLLAADPTEARNAKGDACYPFQADRQAMEPHQKVRLPGVVRRGDAARGAGNRQSLLYLNPGAVRRTTAAT